MPDERNIGIVFVLLQKSAHWELDIPEAVSADESGGLRQTGVAYCDLMRVLICWQMEMT